MLAGGENISHCHSRRAKAKHATHAAGPSLRTLGRRGSRPALTGWILYTHRYRSRLDGSLPKISRWTACGSRWKTSAIPWLR